MTTFAYRAVTADDRSEFGSIEADNPTEAARRLLQRGLYPLDVSTADHSLWETFTTPVRRQRLPAAESAQILVDLGHLIMAGIEVAPALALVASSRPRVRAKDLLAKLIDAVRMGRALSEAMLELGSVFPSYVVAIVRAGEASGAVGPALLRIADTQRRASRLRSQLRTALIYPSFLAAGAVIAILVLVCIVVPNLQALYSGEMHRLPWQTRLLMSLGNALREHAFVLSVLLMLAAMAVPTSIRSKQIRRRIEAIALRIPILGALIAAAETARISLLLSMISSAGLPLASAVALASAGSSLVVSRESLSVAALKLREGASLHQSLLKVPTLTTRMLPLIQIGEKTARLAPLLEEVARDSEYQVSTIIERGLAMLTPVMTLGFGAVAGFVLYAVMTSILSINDLAASGL